MSSFRRIIELPASERAFCLVNPRRLKETPVNPDPFIVA